MRSDTASRSLASSPETRAFLARGRAVVQQFAIILRNMAYYELGNEVFREPIEKLGELLGEVVPQEGKLELERVGGELYANQTRIKMEIRSLHSYKLVWNELSRLELGGVRFEKSCEVSRLLTLFELLRDIKRARDVDDVAAELNDLLAEREVEGIRFLEPRDDSEQMATDAESRRERAIHAYQQALDFIRQSMADVDSPAQVNRRRAKRVVQRLVDLSYEEGDGFSLVGLASIKDHDNYTFNHMVNVCVLAIAFGQRLGLSRRQLAELGLCALYHDMGKLHVPVEILNKKTRLGDEEWARLGNHTVYGARTLFPLLGSDRRMLQPALTALQHHFGFSGRGYPKLRVMRFQDLYTRIVAIVDMYDAMTTKRVYQKEFLPDEALSRIHQKSGSYCDPVLVKAFINCMGIYPVGSTVELASGELAVVVESNADPQKIDRPRVRLVTDARHRFVEPALVDLGEESQGGRRIMRCVDPDAHAINSAHYVV